MRNLITSDSNTDCNPDYTADLKPGESVWLAVGKVVLYIRRTEDAVLVDAFAEGQEDGIALDCLAVYDTTVEDALS